MTCIITDLFAHPDIVRELCAALKFPHQSIQQHRFPDKEIRFTVEWDCKDKTVFLITSLHHPNDKIFPLIMAAQTLKQLDAKAVYLVTPYLPYMRQDIAFHPGEGISAIHFAKLISSFFDGLVTIDPHLHRFKTLDQIYDIPSIAVQSAPVIAQWIQTYIHNAIIIGPDAESDQWIRAIAQLSHLPFVALEKTRLGDKKVEIKIDIIPEIEGKTPVIVDDIISSGYTLIQTCKQLKTLNLPLPIVVATHGIFAEDAYAQLKPLCRQICTTNTILHPTNEIDITSVLAKAMKQMAN